MAYQIWHLLAVWTFEQEGSVIKESGKQESNKESTPESYTKTTASPSAAEISPQSSSSKQASFEVKKTKAKENNIHSSKICSGLEQTKEDNNEGRQTPSCDKTINHVTIWYWSIGEFKGDC